MIALRLSFVVAVVAVRFGFALLYLSEQNGSIAHFRRALISILFGRMR